VSVSDRRFDLLRVPVVGRFLRWRWSRAAMQTPLFLISAVMIWHAFFGPQLAPKNLATLLTWVHFRGLVVLLLLLGGNFFCMACPFMLPRQLARRFIAPQWTWPRWLRNKTPALTLFVGVLFVYEAVDPILPKCREGARGRVCVGPALEGFAGDSNWIWKPHIDE